MTFIFLSSTGAENAHECRLRLLMSIRLLGAEEIITGISSHVAQTMVGLGVELASITTRANLREGLRFCMGKMRERD